MAVLASLFALVGLMAVDGFSLAVPFLSDLNAGYEKNAVAISST